MHFRTENFRLKNGLRSTLLLLVLLVLKFQTAMAQVNYPVHVSTSVLSPSALISDYGAAADIDRIMFTVTLADMQSPPRDVKFKIRIETISGTVVAESRSGFYSDKYTLYPGMPVIIKGKDLNSAADGNLFAIANLSPTGLANILKEGLYKITITAFDDHSGQILSNNQQGYATAFINHLQPPILTLPLNKINLTISTENLSQQIFFSWMPRNNGAPSGASVKYKLLIYDIISDVSPEVVASGTPRITKDISDNIFNLNISELLPSTSTTNRFAWRVQAYFPGNSDYDALFPNNGMSEVFSFTTYPECKAPTSLSMDTIVPLQLTAEWIAGNTSATNPRGYEIHYREKSRWNSWNLQKIGENPTEFKIRELKPDTYYEAIIRQVCATSETGGVEYYSDWVSFPTAKTSISKVPTAASCLAPYAVQFSNTEDGKVKVSWKGGSPNNYRVEYRDTLRTATWQVRTATTDTFDIVDLSAGVYYVRVVALCGDASLQYSDAYMIQAPLGGTMLSCNINIPFNINAQVVAERSQTKISWPAGETDQLYKFSYRQRLGIGKDTVWTTIISGVNYLYIDSLKNGISYECKLDITCINGLTVKSPYYYFQLDDPMLSSGNEGNQTGDCFPPDYATAEVIDNGSIKFSWKASPSATGYKLSYKRRDLGPEYVVATTDKLNYLVTGLTTDSTYEYFVEARCSNDWSIPTATYNVKLIVDPNKSAVCLPVTIDPVATGDKTASSFNIHWSLGSHTGYIVEYRPKASTKPDWYTVSVDISGAVEGKMTATVDHLDDNTYYEYRVKGLCGEQYSEYTDVDTIKTLKDLDVDCGSAHPEPTLSTVPLASAVAVGEKIYAADFELEVVEMASSGATGYFTGKAKVVIKLGPTGSLTFNTDFTNAKFNENKQLIEGKIYLKQIDMQALPEDIRQKINEAISLIDGALETFQQAMNLLMELGGVENKQPIGMSAYHPSLVTSPGVSAGSIAVDNATGAITNKKVEFGVNPGTMIATINKDAANNIKDNITSGLDAAPSSDATLAVTFKPHAKQKYGWDSHVAGVKIDSIYEIAGGKRIDWKSIQTGILDRIDVDISATATQASRDSLKFISLAGIEYKLQKDGNQYFILVSGSTEGTMQEVYAWLADATKDSKGYKIAKVNVAAYRKKTNKVFLVPVKTSTAPDAGPEVFTDAEIASIKSKLNDIYKVAITEWEVAKWDETFSAGTAWDEASNNSTEGDAKLSVTGTDLLDAYTDEMENVISLFRDKYDNVEEKSDIYYLFYGLTPSVADVTGFLPRSRNMGFIFDRSSTVSRTIAHELGHGFTLKHSWDIDALPAKTSTANLMDYHNPPGTELWKSQWEVVQYPKVVIPFFDKDDEAMAKETSDPYLTPGYEMVYLDPLANVYEIVQGGPLVSFTYEAASNNLDVDNKVFKYNSDKRQYLNKALQSPAVYYNSNPVPTINAASLVGKNPVIDLRVVRNESDLNRPENEMVYEAFIVSGSVVYPLISLRKFVILTNSCTSCLDKIQHTPGMFLNYATLYNKERIENNTSHCYLALQFNTTHPGVAGVDMPGLDVYRDFANTCSDAVHVYPNLFYYDKLKEGSYNGHPTFSCLNGVNPVPQFVDVSGAELEEAKKIFGSQKAGQNVSFIKDGHKYEKTPTGGIIKTKDKLSDEVLAAIRNDVKNGNWADKNITNKVLIETNGGKVQVGAFGFHNSIKYPSKVPGQVVNGADVAKKTQDNLNALLNKAQANNKSLDVLSETSKYHDYESPNNQVYFDGKDVDIKDVGFLDLVCEMGTQVAYTFKNGAINPDLYDDNRKPNYANSIIHLPACLSGATDALLYEYKDITDLVGMISQLGDEEFRKALLDMFKKLDGISGEEAVTFLKEAVQEELTRGADLNNLGMDTNIGQYNTTKLGVSGVIAFVAGTKMIYEVGKKIVKKITYRNILKGYSKFGDALKNLGKDQVANSLRSKLEDLVDLGQTTAKGYYAKLNDFPGAVKRLADEVATNPGLVVKDGIDKLVGEIANSLTGSIKNTYNDLLTLGGNPVEANGILKLYDKNGKLLGDIKNEVFTPNEYWDGVGTPVNDEIVNGYQIYKDGDNLVAKRMPDKSPYSSAEQAELYAHGDAHVLERHGHDVTDESLIKRANEGIAPDGSTTSTGRPPAYSSKFDSPEKVKEALNFTKPGTTAFDNKVRSGNTNNYVVEYTLTDGSSFGKGVPKYGSTFVEMNKVLAVYEEVSPGNFQLLTMYPNK